LKASLNKNLLSFTVEIPAILLDEKPLQGTSENRVFLFRRKALVFLPGVFGSQFELDQGDGRKDGFPDFLSDDSFRRLWPVEAVSTIWRGTIKAQRVGALECDEMGVPVLPPFKPKLLRLRGLVNVYDTFNQLHRARTRKLSPVPEDFLVYELFVFAYDWRGDLSACAREMMQRLTKLQTQQLQKGSDWDDQVAIAGHSTGGVIIRKMLGETDATGLISHALFLNVPFRGAPKAMGVFLTGCDPPGGDPMLPIVDAESLRAISPCAPIVYHLAPSFKYPEHIAEIQGSASLTSGRGLDIEAEKAALIRAGVERGIYFPKYAVKAAPWSRETLSEIAAGSNAWGKLMDKWTVHDSGAAAYTDKSFPIPNERFRTWFDLKASGHDSQFQKSVRIPMAWNEGLARKAQRFHEESEKVAASGTWADKAFIFYSKIPDSTTGRIVISSGGSKDCGQNMPSLLFPGCSVTTWMEGEGHPPEPTKIGGALQVEQWEAKDGHLFKRFWTVSAARVEGDGTVPLRSLLGFGGPAKVFQALPGNPPHVPAPNSEWLWDRVIELLQGEDVRKYLRSADTSEGREI